MEISTAVIQLAALAQETRLKIFRLLVEAGADGMNAGDICHQLDIPASTLSFHLKDLTRAGMLNAEKHGRVVIYQANFKVMNSLLNFLQRNCCRRMKGGKCC